MQTHLSELYRDTDKGKTADSILRRCVHCGFCNATCPTYQLGSNELDSPRGRIYLIKQLLEGETATQETQLHLDRCLTCLNCETTCPSGVDYGQLLDIGREIIEQTVPRRPLDRLQRFVIREMLAYPTRFTIILRLGQLLRPFMPGSLRQLVPAKPTIDAFVKTRSHARKILLLGGCVQPGLSPNINHSASKLLDRLGITALAESPTACCGALHHHTSDTKAALNFARRRIDAWWPHVEAGIEAIVSTASGCGVHIKHYDQLLKEDDQYRDKAQKVSQLTRDISEVLVTEDIEQFKPAHNRRIVFHPPCTLQHGQKLSGVVEQILDRAGFVRLPVDENHLCCGAAGSYTLLQPQISSELRQRKLDNLLAEAPDLIVSANIGCLHHLAAVSDRPVRHWVELLAETA